MSDFKPMVHAERASLGEFLDTLTPDQWSAPTWCEKWNVQDLVAHLVAAGNITAPHFFAGFVKAGFSFDKTVETDLRNYSGGTPADVKARYDAIINSDRKPPGPAYVALGEVMVHGEDIRRSFGARGEHSEEHLVTLAEAYKGTGPPLRGKKRSAGLKFTATDIEWTCGEGPEVTGPCMSLVMGMVGREGALADCAGAGLETLRARV